MLRIQVRAAGIRFMKMNCSDTKVGTPKGALIGRDVRGRVRGWRSRPVGLTRGALQHVRIGDARCGATPAGSAASCRGIRVHVPRVFLLEGGGRFSHARFLSAAGHKSLAA